MSKHGLEKTTPRDIAYSAARAAVGSVPVVGAAASELLGLIVASPLEKKRSKFLIEIGERLKELEESKRIDISSLSENEHFVDTVAQATVHALKTSEEEKIRAFRNSIINTALKYSPDKTFSHIFLNLIDAFTVWHIRILKLFNDPEEWFKVHKKNFPGYLSSGLSSVVTEAYPELKGQRELLDIIWKDLERANLHNSGSLNTMMTSSGLLSPRTTELGRKFLEFIEEKQ